MNRSRSISFVLALIFTPFLTYAQPPAAPGGKPEAELIEALDNAKTAQSRSDALTKISSYYLSVNRLDKAVDSYRRTINDANIGKKEKYQYYNSIGDIYLDAKQYSSAIEYYQEAINVAPKLEATRLKLASVYEQSDLNELAKQAYLEDLKFNKRSFDANFGLASLYMKMGLNTQAMEYYRSAITIKAAPEVYRKTALCAETSGDVCIALTMLRHVPQEQLKFDDLISLGRLYSANNKFKEAEESFSAALKMNTENIEGYIYLALLYVDRNDLEPAENLLRIALEKAPEEGAVHFFLGCIYNSQNKYDLSREEMKRAGALARTDMLKKYSLKYQQFLPK